jgi:Fur family ferric uptake transcriptional regulator
MPKKDYQTKQREYLTAVFTKNPAAGLTAEDVKARADADGIAVGLTTVYRNLEKLARDGVLTKRVSADRRAYFYAAHPGDGRCRLFCVGCGHETPLACGYIAGLSRHLAERHRFHFQNRGTVLYGLCEACEKAQSGKK